MNARAATRPALAAVPVSEHDARIAEKLRRELDFLLPFLEDDAVQEIFVNPDGAVFVDRAGEPRRHEGFIAGTKVAGLLATVASSLHTTINRERPHIDGVLPLDGSRISGEIPPMVTGPSMRIRKHARVVRDLAWFVEQGTMTACQAERLRAALRSKANVVVVGTTGSGKTFLANSLLKELSIVCPHDRVLTIEDTAELVTSSADALAWTTSPEVDMRLMLRRALRATPDRIVVGEVRGAEAYQLLKMWNTGHGGGLATIHSDRGALDGLTRLERMCGESPEVAGMGRGWIRELVGDVVHLLVSITKTPAGRRVERIVEVRGFDAASGTYTVHETDPHHRSRDEETPTR